MSELRDREEEERERGNQARKRVSRPSGFKSLSVPERQRDSEPIVPAVSYLQWREERGPIERKTAELIVVAKVFLCE